MSDLQYVSAKVDLNVDVHHGSGKTDRYLNISKPLRLTVDVPVQKSLNLGLMFSDEKFCGGKLDFKTLDHPETGRDGAVFVFQFQNVAELDHVLKVVKKLAGPTEPGESTNYYTLAKGSEPDKIHRQGAALEKTVGQIVKQLEGAGVPFRFA